MNTKSPTKYKPLLLLLGVLLLTLNCRAYSQSTNWDSILTGSQWYVPPQNKLAYLTSTSNLTQTVQVGDQTLWSITSCVNGVFAGTSSQSLTIPYSGGGNQTASNTGMNGFINNAGQVLIDFATTNGGPPTIALGNYRDVIGETTNLIEMQMISQISSDQYITHWAYMASYTNVNYPTTTPSNSAFLSTNWQWMQGTTWNITGTNLFGTNGSGSFAISTYNSGYFWGNGTGTTNGGFTLIGSATPEGNLILGLLNSTNGLETSLFGTISGGVSNSVISLNSYSASGTNSDVVASAVIVSGSIANLYVTNGASLSLTNGINSYTYTYVGNAASDSNNALTVANANTMLTNFEDLYVGNLGSGNTMVITNGAVADSRSGFIGYDASASTNLVLVTGSNSFWINSADLYVGYSGSSNSLIITNGAKVLGSNTYISSFEGSNNSVQVSGTGSTLSNSGSIWVGASPVDGVAGTGTLTITSGGTIVASNLIISGATNSVGTVEVGLKGGSDYNMTLNVPLITFGEGTGSLGLNQSDTLTISGSIQGATATNSYAMIQQYGSGTTILTGNSHTGLGYRVDGGQLMVNGGILDIYLIDGLSPDELGGPRTVTVGNKYSGISLVVTNGGELHSFVTIIGTDLIKNSDTLTTSSNNCAVITGPGSKLIAGELQIGNVSSGNSLVISNGATASSALSTSIGISGSQNSVIVNGTGSIFSNIGSLTVGTYSQSYDSFANLLLVTNGGGLASGSATIGNTTNSFGNSVTVSGSGSFWTNNGNLILGNGGSSNNLIIVNGGDVVSSNSFISYTATSSNNSILVTGSGGNSSTLSNIGTLSIGYAGSGFLTVAEGALVVASGGITIAAQAGSTGTLNIGSFGTNDTAGTISAGTIAFGSGSGTINFNQSDSTILTSSILGAGTVRQLGTGTTVMTGSNTYTGTTLVTNGTLLANNTSGSAVGTSALTITNAGKLGGTGTIGGNTAIASGGTLSPGTNGVGSLTFTNSLTLQNNSTTAFVVTATNYFTSINLSGGILSYGGTLTVDMSNYTPVAGDFFDLFNFSNGASSSGDLSAFQNGSLLFSDSNGVWIASSGGFQYQFADATGRLTISSQSIPEPSTYALFGLGALALVVAYRRRIA